MLLALLLAVLFDRTFEVPASRWRILDLPVPTAEMLLEAEFQVKDKNSRVAAVLLTREDAIRFEQGRSMKPIASTGWEYDGRFRHVFRNPGNYAIVIDNRIEGRRATPVAVKVELTDPKQTTVRELSPQRRLVVIATSLLVFVAIVMFTARQFMR
jgi:hypothetical protein